MKKDSLIYTVFSALFVVFTAICSYISVPFVIPFTLQTFAISLIFFTLPPSYGILTVVAYIISGLLGIPVFSGFTGGVGVLLGPTGGYIIGFIVMGIAYYVLVELLKIRYKIICMFSGLILCYITGTLWFFIVFAGERGIISILSVCVFPFIIPDIVKISLAFFLSRKFSVLKMK